jgi:hypothetical protein
VVWDDPVVHAIGLYFGDAKVEDDRPDLDDVHIVTSAYRPPPAVVALARKQFDRPVWLLATKPQYDRVGHRPPFEEWTFGDDRKPKFWEATYIGKTFQMGSAVSDAPDVPVEKLGKHDHWNMLTFKLVADNSKRGVDAFVATPNRLGPAEKLVGEQIAQNRNLLIYLARGGSTFQFMVPTSATIQRKDGALLVGLEKTTLAIQPIRMDLPGIDAEATKAFQHRKGKLVRPDESVMVGKGEGGKAPVGFAMIVLDGVTIDKAEAAMAEAKLAVDGDTVGLADGTHTLKMVYNRENDLPKIWRDGEAFDYSANPDMYHVADGPAAIDAAYHGGKLSVQAGGRTFTGELRRDGTYTFENK